LMMMSVDDRFDRRASRTYFAQFHDTIGSSFLASNPRAGRRVTTWTFTRPTAMSVRNRFKHSFCVGSHPRSRDAHRSMYRGQALWTSQLVLRGAISKV
jgi:hypothetical protein